MDTTPARPAIASRSRIGVLAAALGAVLLLAVPEVAADVATRRVVDGQVPQLVRAPDVVLAEAATTTVAPAITVATTAPAPPPPTTSTTVAPTTTTTPPAPVRSSVDLGGGLQLEVVTPAGPGPHPTLVYVHGGGWVSGDHLEWPTEFGLGELPARGWAVASVGYRLADRASGIDALHQTAEVVRALRWVRTDGTTLGLGGRVVAMGHSAGAHLVTLAAAGVDAPFAPDAVIGVAGIYDFAEDVTTNPFLEPVLPHALGCEPAECSDERVASLRPISAADPGDPTVVLVHGADDPIAPVRTADDFAGGLQAAGVPSEEVVVTGAGHFDDALGTAVRQVLDRVLAG